MPYCECRCGDRTGGGVFLPGHDQRLRSALEKAVGSLLELRGLVEKETGRQIKCAAKAAKE
jgi:hypothetical protein